MLEEKVNVPLVKTLKLLPELSWMTSPVPWTPVMVPPTVYFPSKLHDASVIPTAIRTIHDMNFTKLPPGLSSYCRL